MTSNQNTPVQATSIQSTTHALQELSARATQGIAITIQGTTTPQSSSKSKTLTLRDRAIAAAARGDAKDTQHAPARSPLDKYTSTLEMPRVQDPFPAAVIANIDLATLDEWFSNEGQKILIIPFEDKARDPNLRLDIARKILTAFEDITAAQKVEIAPPVPISESAKPRQMPITYLASHLTRTEYDAMMSRHVWSSEAITFRVIPMDPPCPDFLFTLRGFTTLDESRIYNMVSRVWNDDKTKNFISRETNAAHTDNKVETERTLKHLINSLKVTQLKIKSKGSALTPHFNIYTDGKSTTDEELWVNLRTFLASREYKLPLQGMGKVIKAPFTCGACHSVDHPRGLCPFPDIKGWNGPLHHAEDDPHYRGHPYSRIA
jgi:hypothetical protein